MVLTWTSQVGLVVKNIPANAGGIRDVGSIPGLGGTPGEGNGNPLQYSCLENPTDGQRNLAGNSSCSCKESDMTEHAYTHMHALGTYTDITMNMLCPDD